GDVVTGVLLRAGHERAQPDRVDAETLQVVQTAGDAGEVADPVAGGVREGAGVDLVDDGAAPPFGTGGCDLFELCHATRLLQALAVRAPNDRIGSIWGGDAHSRVRAEGATGEDEGRSGGDDHVQGRLARQHPLDLGADEPGDARVHRGGGPAAVRGH